MATDKTVVVSARVPQAIAEELSRDAKDFNRSPGAHLRALIEGRYSARSMVGIANASARKIDSETNWPGVNHGDDD